ncbi:hypothetical protein CCHL11_05516 [Colletotrichum chlorophyti]|uniref:Uncharacterized protein n=1 Tax=Colletotrichum chlorophyti TaxID=708187 RepID=A0A1Q8RBC1_9PEZI|nr:hypothetical protein CCHL11_05516 [Colletotrichum chlorophyti]
MAPRSKRLKAKVRAKAKAETVNGKKNRAGKGGNSNVDGFENNSGSSTSGSYNVSMQPTQANKNNRFRRCPVEIRQAIYRFAVVQDEPIQPVPVEPRSNKFAGPQAARTFTNLLLTCRFLYEEVQSRPDFYRQNTFGFVYISKMVQFLAALTPHRRSWISSIFLWIHVSRPPSYWTRQWVQPAITLLSHCTSLRRFHVIGSQDLWRGERRSMWMKSWANNLTSCGPSLEKSCNPWSILGRLRNLRHFGLTLRVQHHDANEEVVSNLTISEDPAKLKMTGNFGFVDTDADLMRELRLLISRLKAISKDICSADESWVPMTGIRLQEALHASGLDVYGEDRLGHPGQAGMVSRRTRSRALRAMQISTNGVIPIIERNLKYVDKSEDEDGIDFAVRED